MNARPLRFRPVAGQSLLGPLALALLLLLGTGTSLAAPRTDWAAARNRMVDEEIVAAGVKNPRVVQAMRDTPRHEFVATAERDNAYFDMALPIGEGQTISPPFVVAYMTEQLDPQPADKVLEIGTGSGFQAAVLSPLVKEVYTIEIVKSLGQRAKATLKRLKYANVQVKVGDGYQGWPEHAPFDKIVVTCSPESVPQALVDQLKDGGRMVIPVGERYQQTLYLFRKENGKLVSDVLLPTLFVPMTGAAEAGRKTLPNPARPVIVNGGFEESLDDETVASGWHYVRQMQRVAGDDAPSGRHYARFSNAEPGRNCHALQGLAIDGRKVRQFEVSLWVKCDNVAVGRDKKELAILAIVFYDAQRATAGYTFLGPWKGTFDWRREVETVRVPPDAREAIFRVGLHGATGTLSVDDVAIEPVGTGK